MDGIINIYKEAGWTSHDVVAKLRSMLGQKKIGHTGTLDPDATGVLPVCLGKATKLCDMLTDDRKTYEAVLLLGTVTDTQDISGSVLEKHEAAVTETEVSACLASFEGERLQTPPMYSARKVKGRKLYELAREGKTVAREARPVHFYQIEILRMQLPEICFRVTCSKGTYIRTLCHDIGQELGCGGCMKSLVRTQSGRFAIAESRTLDEVQESVRLGTVRDLVLPVDAVFAELPAIRVSGHVQRLVDNGNPVAASQVDSCQWIRSGLSGAEWFSKPFPADGQKIRVYDENGGFVGIYRYRKETEQFRPLKMFKTGET